MNKLSASIRPLVLILLLAFGLRLIALSSRTFWYDEAFAVLFSEKGLNGMLYGTLTPENGTAADVHPLLYYTTLNAWMAVFGSDLAVVRLYGVLLGVATIGMLYLLARDLFGEKTGLVAAFIAAVAPYHVQYSQEARMYALLGLLLIAATWSFVRGWRTGQTRYWIGFGILAGLSMYAQQLAGFYLVALGLAALFSRQRDLILRTGLSAGLAMLVYLPWLVNLPAQLGKVGNYWIMRPTPAQPLITLWSYIFVDLEVRSAAVAALTLTTLSMLLVFLIWRASIILRRHHSERDSLTLTLWLAVGPIALMWLVSQWRPVYLTRALLPSGLMFYVALAWLLTCARLPRVIQGILILPWAATILIGLYTHYTWNTFPRPPFDRADQWLAQRIEAGDQIIHANKLTMLPMFYYNRQLPHTYIRDVPGSGQDTLARPTQETLNLLADDSVEIAAQGSRRIWFVVFRQQIEQSGGSLPELAWLDQHYERVSVQPFNDLMIYLYERPLL
jgi:mannosyltransferase